MSEEAALTPAQHLRALLTRVQNPFDVSDAVLAQLTEAVLHQVALHSSRHSSRPGHRNRTHPAPVARCSTHRHSFLLADGSSVVLWELRYDSERCAAKPPLAEVYEDEAALRHAERRVHERQGGFSPFEALGGLDARVDGIPGAAVPRFSAGARRGREYSERDSPEHARRLLRRAENSDRPGDETLQLLATALRHEIMHVPKPHTLARQWHIWCSVYEHAFLLRDGREISLYELEHDLSGTGRLVCEVYLEEGVADQAAHRRARDLGIGG